MKHLYHQVWQPQPGGLLCVRLHSVSGLPKKSKTIWVFSTKKFKSKTSDRRFIWAQTRWQSAKTCWPAQAWSLRIGQDWRAGEGHQVLSFALNWAPLFQLVCTDLTLIFLSSVARNTQQHTWDEWHGFVMEEVGLKLRNSTCTWIQKTNIETNLCPDWGTCARSGHNGRG